MSNIKIRDMALQVIELLLTRWWGKGSIAIRIWGILSGVKGKSGSMEANKYKQIQDQTNRLIITPIKMIV